MTVTQEIGARHYRDVMGHLPTGAVVVAGRDPRTGRPAGLVVGTFQSLSLAPALVSFSVGSQSSSWPRVRASGCFSASILGAHQRSECLAVAARGEDKFAALDWHEGTQGAPRIAGAHAYVDAEVEQEIEGGDHVIVIARVIAMTPGTGEPLVFHRGRLGGYVAA